MKITELIELLTKTAGSTAKKQILEENNSELLKNIFDYTFGGRKYYVRKYSVSGVGEKTLESDWDSVKEMLDKLAAKEISGNAAIELIDRTVSEFTIDDQNIIKLMFGGNLKCGVSLSSYESVNGAVKRIKDRLPVALAVNLNHASGINPIDGTFFASRKLDGCRCICKANKNGNIIFLSRGNKEFKTLGNVEMAVRALLMAQEEHDELIFDGEICILDENGDEHFDWVIKEISRKNHTIQNPCYNIFDCLTPDEYYARTESPIFSKRLERMQSMFNNLEVERKEIRLLKQERITSQEDFDRWAKYVEEGNWEGFMLRKDAPFKGERTKDLLKVKQFQDAEYTVEGVDIGKMVFAENGNITFDVVRSLIINHKGNHVSVGSGLSKEQRLDWFEHPEHIIGKTITVKYFEETTNASNNMLSLRFPVLKAVYENGRNC